MVTTAPVSSVLSDDLIARCGERVASYDRENRFFAEDFEELKQAGYLLSAVPRELGGHGLSLAEMCREQRRLAYRAPSTALAVGMHQIATGIAADLYRQGDHSQVWLLEEVVKGEVIASGHSEVGNDMPVVFSTSRAVRVDGGYRFTAHKSFGSLTPVWTRLMIHTADDADPANPMVVHAYMPRDTPGVRVEETWDTLGMRPTASHDTIVEDAFVADRYIARVLPAGFGGADLYILSMFGWGLPMISSVYLAIAERAFDLAVQTAKRRTSIAGMTRSMAYHPEVQHQIAEMLIELEGAVAHHERIADDWTNGVDHGGMWAAKLVAMKYHVVEAAKRIVDLALDISGGNGMYKRSELERLYRDVRCGGFHPANAALAHEVAGKTALGIDLSELPRWG